MRSGCAVAPDRHLTALSHRSLPRTCRPGGGTRSAPVCRGNRTHMALHDDPVTGQLWRAVAVLAACLALLTVGVATSWAPLLRLDHAVARSAFDTTYAHS